MIVQKPISPQKINGTLARLTVGRPVPASVLEYWEKTNQLAALKKSGVISDGKTKPVNDNYIKKEEEKKDQKKQDTERLNFNDTFRQTEER